MKTPNSSKPQPGDLVEISLVKTSYRGILLETPEDEKGIVLLKLNSGYNIGFNKKEIYMDFMINHKIMNNNICGT